MLKETVILQIVSILKPYMSEISVYVSDLLSHSKRKGILPLFKQTLTQNLASAGSLASDLIYWMCHFRDICLFSFISKWSFLLPLGRRGHAFLLCLHTWRTQIKSKCLMSETFSCPLKCQAQVHPLRSWFTSSRDRFLVLTYLLTRANVGGTCPC